MTFEELLALYPSDNAPAVRIDSRLVKTGDIFVAIKGTAADGHDYIDQALSRGAKYILANKSCQCTCAEMIIVPDTAKAAALLAQTAKGCPASRLTNLAVTGTNGKTTVAFLTQSCIRKAGETCGLVGTILCDTGKAVYESTLTTPDSLQLAQLTEEMARAGTKYAVIEASSHALSQNRLAGFSFKAAAFTNLTGDHLDYHKTQQSYLNAKSLLFEQLDKNSFAILNKQSPHAAAIARKTKASILWYAIDQPADITANIESMDITGTVFTLEYAGRRQKLKTPLLGQHNLSNILAAAGLCLAAGFDFESIAPAFENPDPIPGRLEKIYSAADFSVIIDYAHTDDALKNVLTTLRPLCNGKLIVVFGCGGDRDKTKRPRMAAVAEKYADTIIITNDNPRTEQTEYIIGEIMTGFENPVAETITVELDRKKAIELALKNAAKNDIVLIAGKGHETYQILGDRKIHFSDKETVIDCLKNLK